MSSDSNLEKVYERSDDLDRSLTEERQRSLWVSLSANAFLVLVTIAALLFAIFRPVEIVKVPLLVRVNAAGQFDVPVLVDDKTLHADEAYSWVWMYVRARESYARHTWPYHYDVAIVMTSPEMKGGRDEIKALFNWNDRKAYPNSLYARYGENGGAELEFRYVNRIGNPDDNIIEVHYYLKEFFSGDPTPKITAWVATVHYRFEPKIIGSTAQHINAVGFQVLHYVKAQEFVNSAVKEARQ